MKQMIAVYNNMTGIAQKMEFLCRGEQIGVVSVDSEEKLEHLIADREIQMVLLDIFMEEQGWGEGIRLISRLRRFCRLPIVVVSGQESEKAKIAALSCGADDYLNADDNPLVIFAHIKSQLRRYVQLSSICDKVDQIYCIDGLEIDDNQRKLTVDGREVKLTPTEYQILRLLVKEKGKVLSINQIYEAIWKMHAVGVDNTIAVHIRHIREKIEQNPRQPKYLKVIWGTGYMVG